MASAYDFSIDQGSVLELTLVAVDNNGTPLNLSGYQAQGKIKYQYGDASSLLPLTTSIDNSYVSGLINISLTAEQTAALPVTKAVYDIELLGSGNYVSKVFNGYAEINPSTMTDEYTANPRPAKRQVFFGVGAPTAPPTDPSDAAIYYDISTYQTYFWNINTQSW